MSEAAKTATGRSLHPSKHCDKTFEENRPLPSDEIILLTPTDDIEIRSLVANKLAKKNRTTRCGLSLPCAAQLLEKDASGVPNTPDRG